MENRYKEGESIFLRADILSDKNPYFAKHLFAKQELITRARLRGQDFANKAWTELTLAGLSQSRTQACSRYLSDHRRLGTKRDRRIFPTSLTGDVTSEIAEDDWERGWGYPTIKSNS